MPDRVRWWCAAGWLAGVGLPYLAGKPTVLDGGLAAPAALPLPLMLELGVRAPRRLSREGEARVDSSNWMDVEAVGAAEVGLGLGLAMVAWGGAAGLGKMEKERDGVKQRRERLGRSSKASGRWRRRRRMLVLEHAWKPD